MDVTLRNYRDFEFVRNLKDQFLRQVLADLSYVGPITVNLEALSGNTCLSDTDSS